MKKTDTETLANGLDHIVETRNPKEDDFSTIKEAAQRLRELQEKQQRIYNGVMDNVEEVHNNIGGVIGYKLNLNPKDTEELLREIER